MVVSSVYASFESDIVSTIVLMRLIAAIMMAIMPPPFFLILFVFLVVSRPFSSNQQAGSRLAFLMIAMKALCFICYFPNIFSNMDNILSSGDISGHGSTKILPSSMSLSISE